VTISIGATGVEELEEGHGPHVVDRDGLLVDVETGNTGMLGELELVEFAHVAHTVGEDELVFAGRTGVTGATGLDEDEDEDHWPQLGS
jgi:hypothetical protein